MARPQVSDEIVQQMNATIDPHTKFDPANLTFEQRLELLLAVVDETQNQQFSGLGNNQLTEQRQTRNHGINRR